MASIDKVNFSSVEQTETKKQEVKPQETNTIWDKYDTDGDGVFSQNDDLYKGIAKEISYREKNNRDSKLTEQLKDLLNNVGQTFDVIHQKIQTMYKERYGEGDYKDISEKFMSGRAEMAKQNDDEAFNEY